MGNKYKVEEVEVIEEIKSSDFLPTVMALLFLVATLMISLMLLGSLFMRDFLESYVLVSTLIILFLICLCAYFSADEKVEEIVSKIKIRRKI